MNTITAIVTSILGLIVSPFQSPYFANLDSIIQQSKGLKPEILKLAMQAHQCVGENLNNKHIITILDYSKPSNQNRLWVIDLKKQKVLYETMVAHGQGSGENYAYSFSDRPGSKQSSIGVFLTGNIYFGKNGLSMELHGLEKGFNANAIDRKIVVHGAPYVDESIIKYKGRLGRSLGCPTLNPKLTKPIIDTIKNGSLFFSYYPNKNWLSQSSYLNCSKYKKSVVS